MEEAALWIALVSAFATGAATIVAWVSRADALAARTSADAAQVAAVDAWRRAADALEDANSLQLRIRDDAIMRERRLRRVELSSLLRDWYATEYIRITTGKDMTESERTARQVLTTRVQASDEPAGPTLQILLDRYATTISKGDATSALVALMKSVQLTDEWVDDPLVFGEAHADEISHDELFESVLAAHEKLAQLGNNDG